VGAVCPITDRRQVGGGDTCLPGLESPHDNRSSKRSEITRAPRGHDSSFGR